ncbi:MAG: hypothetical protein ACTHLR_02565, partial [Rhizomicrobium sp.]
MKIWHFGLLGVLALVAVLLAVFWRPVSETADLATHRIVDVEFDPAHPEDFRINAKDVRCGADLVESVQSRDYTNQGDLEFWCREKHQPLPVFKNIGKAFPEQFGSSLANVSGRMYELVSESYYKNGAWRFWNKKNHDRIDNGRTINLQQRNGITYRFVIEGRKCTGVSIFSDEGYHGTYQGKDWADWSAMYTDGKIVAANIGHRMRIGNLPRATSFDRCRALSLQPVGPPDWIYAITPIKGGLLYGGSTPYIHGECAMLRFLDLRTHTVQTIPLPNCKDGLVTEFYSFARFGKKLLVGLYPYGRLFEFDPATHKVVPTNFGKLRPQDKLYDGLPYRESQSVLVADGYVFIGMYPGSELFVHEENDPNKLSVIRMLKSPPRNDGDWTPYSTVLTQMMLKSTGAKDVRSIPPSVQQSLRDRALYMDSWSQRIPSVTLFSGKLCAATANFTGLPYDPK